VSERPRRRGLTYPDGSPPATRIDRGDARYPGELEDLQEIAPPFLWTRGSLDVLDVKPRVAVVGTRRVTPYGQRVTREIAGSLARAGACVISGLARGVDGTAHRSALEVGGATIAVLGTGLDIPFPLAHRDLQATIAQRGLLISELDHQDHGMKFTFPERNRIIAALATLIIVVEAPERSGALNTAVHALHLGRDIAAVPGPIDQPQSVGTNRLIRDGAVALTTVEDALALVGLTPPARTPRVAPDGDEGRVWSALAEGPLDMDALCHRSGLPAAQCMAAVTRLEIAGAIECALSGEVRRR
jgi:DNA processing protein